MSRIKTAIAGGAMLLTAIFGATSAQALPVSEYNAIPLEQKGSVLQQVIGAAYGHMRDQGASSEKLQCIRDYFTAQQMTVGNDNVIINRGIEHVLDELDKATRLDQTDIALENIVVGVINAQCDGVDVANTPDAPVTTPPEPVPTPG